MRNTSILALAVGFALTLSGCGGGSQAPTTLLTAIDATRAASSLTVSARISARLGSQFSYAVSERGEINAMDDGRLTVTAPGLSMRVLSSPRGVWVAVRRPTLPSALTKGRPYLRVDRGSLPQFGELGSVDQTLAILDELRGAYNVKQHDGHYTFSLNPAVALASTPPNRRAALRAEINIVKFGSGSSPCQPSYTGTATLTGPRITVITVAVHAQCQGQSVFAGLGARLSGFDRPVTVTPPPARETTAIQSRTLRNVLQHLYSTLASYNSA